MTKTGERRIENDQTGFKLATSVGGGHRRARTGVDAFDRKLDMVAENIGDALCYHSAGSGLGFAPACAGAFRPRSGPI